MSRRRIWWLFHRRGVHGCDGLPVHTYGLSPRELARKIILDVLETTGLTATAGIGTNLFLSARWPWILWQNTSRRMRRACASRSWTRLRFGRELWDHRPLHGFLAGRPRVLRKSCQSTGFSPWGISPSALERTKNFYIRLFGENAELLIDHAWGWEPRTVAAIKAYRPASSSLTPARCFLALMRQSRPGW